MRSLAPLAIGVPTPSITANSTPEYRFCEDVLHVLHSLEDALLLAHSAAHDLRKPAGQAFKTLFAASVSQLTEPTALCRPLQTFDNDLYLPPPRPLRSAKCIRLATIIFLDVAIRELFDAPHSQMGLYARQLKKRFLGLGTRAATTTTPWGRSLEMCIAVLLQADRMALERPWRGWYFADALTLTMKLGEGSWAEVEAEMMAYLNEEAETRARENQEGPMTEAADEEVGRASTKVWDLAEVVVSFLRRWEEEG